MELVDRVPRGYRFFPMAEELVVDYLANWVTDSSLPGRVVSFTDVYDTKLLNLLEGDWQEGYFFVECKPKNNGGSHVDQKISSDSWTLNKWQESVKSIIDGCEMVVGRKSFLSFNDERRRTPGGLCTSTRWVLPSSRGEFCVT
ncbi:hypothetical protein BHE74_00024481 [Ensete ventricosum]|uniref:Uncharacterized protein n=1 Tax=Ensete ventricosum TaxID=4639 RepID=A0A444C2P7_ENSVE|nr:hypothetical protein GW17_00058641 [Ensete ventricosum]RWW68024.1 hypothetical protein BHE74_00024481 [Ensete ventricosum]RZR72151.1 hypothetical protein BHM03_00010861 [Ensete ventricosum]